MTEGYIKLIKDFTVHAMSCDKVFGNAVLEDALKVVFIRIKEPKKAEPLKEILKCPKYPEVFKSGFNCSLERLDKLKAKFLELEIPKGDIIGDIYEDFMNMLSSKLKQAFGQYFTPSHLVEKMIKNTLPLLPLDGKIKVLDPFMGSAKLLMSVKRNLPKAEIHGVEVLRGTYEMSLINVILNGHSTAGLSNLNAIYEEEKIKEGYDLIIANPPFGVKLDKKKIKFSDVRLCIGVCLDLIVKKLKKGGIGCVIVPQNGLTFSDKHTTYRKAFSEKCEIIQILDNSGGVDFKHTKAQTLTIIFRKRANGEQHQTIKMNEELIKQLDDKHRWLPMLYEEQKMDVRTIKERNRRNAEKWQNIQRMTYEVAKINYPKLPEDVKIGTIGEYFNITTGKHHTSHGKAEGKYPFLTASQFITKKCNKADFNPPCLVLSRGGKPAVHLMKEKFSCSGSTRVLEPKNKDLSLQAVYFYLRENLDVLDKTFLGVALKHSKIELLEKIQIPVVFGNNDFLKWLIFKDTLKKLLS